MRQDLATYASDLKTEQDHAVSVMLLDLCSLCASWLTLHNTTVSVLPCMAHLQCNAGHIQAAAGSYICSSSACREASPQQGKGAAEKVMRLFL